VTTALLRSNIELSTRIARLEDRFDTNGSVTTYQRTSLDTITPFQSNPGTAELEDLRMELSTMPFDDSRVVPFEHDLEASRVYQKARGSSAAFSFRSSIARSHAWPYLSYISLSDISIISVVALPIVPKDIINARRYTFLEATASSPESTTLAKPDSPYTNHTSEAARLPRSLRPISSLTKFNITVVGSLEAGTRDLVEKVCSCEVTRCDVLTAGSLLHYRRA
jgi:hypothetical protein